MLKGIPQIISPELLKVLCEMGHGDQIVIADGNFPAASIGKEGKVLRYDGHGALEILTAILDVFPLDELCDQPVKLMEVSPGDEVDTPIWADYEQLVSRYDPRGSKVIGTLERYEFYRQASRAYCVIATGEKALYANLIIQKGVVRTN